MRIRNRHPDAHAAKQYSTVRLSAKPDGKGHVTYTNDTSDYGTVQAFSCSGLKGMTYLFRTSGCDCSGNFFHLLSDGSFASSGTQPENIVVWVKPGASCTVTEYCIVASVEFKVLQAVGIGCFDAETAPY